MVHSRSGRRWTGRLAGLLALGLLLGSSAADGGIRTEHFFLTIIAILIGAKLLGELAERIGQPAVLGELIAGVLIGPSVLALLPTAGPISEVVHLLAEIGVAVLLFEIGLETDLKEMFRVGGSATMVALVGVAAPFLLGFAFWYVVQPAIGVTPAGISPMLVAVFVGATLTATSVGITARVLTDLNRVHTREARVVIGAAVVDDVLGLVILAIVSGLAAGAALTLFGIAMKFVIAAGFLVAAVILGNVIAPRLFAFVDSMRVRGVLLVVAFCFALLFAALAGLAGSAMIIGSFAAGIVLSSTNQFDMIEERIAPVADIFTPIFFVSVGAGVNLNLFLPWTSTFDGGVLLVGAVLLAIAIIGKVVSGYAVGWGRNPLNHLAIGVGMIPRGEVGLIFAHLGLTNGILSPEVYSAILIMVIFTTFLAPPLLKPIFARMDAPPADAPLRTPGLHAQGHAPSVTP
ncbi:MAG TPA: cation:proton antiporter [Longimicrobiales bacterium]|nr:cation:proton antiporter [Longimicrobiales bacterium]